MCKASQEGEHLSLASASRFSNETGDHRCLGFKRVNFQPLPKRLSSSMCMASAFEIKYHPNVFFHIISDFSVLQAF